MTTGSRVLGSSGSQVPGSSGSQVGSSGAQVHGAAGASGPEERLPLVFAGILALEVFVVVALYWFGAHFS